MANWGDLPHEMKRIVIGNMNLSTRSCLKQCSKMDKYLVESTHFHVKRAYIADKSDKDNETIKYRSCLIDNIRMTALDDILIVRRLSDGYQKGKVIIRRYDHVKYIRLDSPKDYLTNWFITILSTGIRSDWFFTNIPLPVDLIDNNFKIYTNDITVKDLNVEETMKWFNVTDPSYKSYGLFADTIEEEFPYLVTFPLIAKNGTIEVENDITDDRLLEFKPTQYLYISKSEITTIGVERLITRMREMPDAYPTGVLYCINIINVDDNLMYHEEPDERTWEQFLEGTQYVPHTPPIKENLTEGARVRISPTKDVVLEAIWPFTIQLTVTDRDMPAPEINEDDDDKLYDEDYDDLGLDFVNPIKWYRFNNNEMIELMAIVIFVVWLILLNFSRRK